MRQGAKIHSQPKTLATVRMPRLLDEILPSLKIRNVRKWFEENLIIGRSKNPILIKDPLGRHLKIQKARFDHLIHADSPSGKPPTINHLKVRCLPLLKPCLEYPLEIYRTRDGAFVYISSWKPVKGTRYVAICRRVGSALELRTHIIMDDKSVEKIRREGKFEWERDK